MVKVERSFPAPESLRKRQRRQPEDMTNRM